MKLQFEILIPGLVLFCCLYYALKVPWQNRFLLAANLAFQALWSWIIPLFLFSGALWIYLCGTQIQRTRSDRVRKLYLGLGLTPSLGLLLLLKLRSHALIESAEQSAFAVTLLLSAWASFYVLQLTGYLIDVYRDQNSAIRELNRFLLFATFFPSSLSGPIERAGHLGAQFKQRRNFDVSRICDGAFLICLGLFKRFAISNPLEALGKTPVENFYGWGLLLSGIFSFFETYALFSGYIDVARGVAKFLGIDLVLNFDQPYLSTNVSELWHRWHMSLIAWLRDFVYIPAMLALRNIYAATALTMILVGLWHDISIFYLLWGIYWTLVLSVYLYLRTKRIFGPRGFMISALGSRPTAILGGIATFLVILFGGLFLRVNSPLGFATVIKHLVELKPGSFNSLLQNGATSFKQVTLASLCILLMIAIETWNRPQTLSPAFTMRNLWIRTIPACALLIFAAAAFGEFRVREIIYLRF